MGGSSFSGHGDEEGKADENDAPTYLKELGAGRSVGTPVSRGSGHKGN